MTETLNDIPIGQRLRNLAPSGWPRARQLIWRAIRRRCPLCGSRGIFRGWMNLKDECPSCGYGFIREGGYFLGAYAVNLLIAEFIPVGLMIALLIWADLSWIELEAILIPLAVALPFLFYPYARSLWMALDLVFTPENQR